MPAEGHTRTGAIALAPSPVAAATAYRAGADADREHGDAGPNGAAVPAWSSLSEVTVGQLDVGPDETVVSGRIPASQLVAGSAPMKQKSLSTAGLRGVRCPVGDGDFLEVTAIQPGDLPGTVPSPAVGQQPVDEIGRHLGRDVRAADD
jgi:hypothetical protein